jgi:hypothetical protein
MIDRLALLLLAGGCLLFGAILIMEFAPAGAEDEVVAQAARSDAASPTTRRQNPRPEELVATALDRSSAARGGLLRTLPAELPLTRISPMRG